MKEGLIKYFKIKDDQADMDEIQQRISSGAKLGGTNIYILIFAILIACIGLNMDSTAIVIGAMLISPLMGIILSMAYGIANHDIAWIKKSFSGFFFQVAISIVTSTLYFLISPIHVFSGELAARTNPSIFDVIIAVLGGSAAIIANTRKNLVSNVIPGTAIATALMPPLCTVGYCLASGKWMLALGAAYLFTINTIFICLSALIGLHVMHITHNKQLLKSAKSRIILTALLVVAIIPSSFLAWQTVHDTKLQKNFNAFLKNEFQFNNSQVVTSDIDPTSNTISVSLIGSVISNESIDLLKESMSNYQLENYSLEIIQTQIEAGITKEELDKIISAGKDQFFNSNISQELEDLKLLQSIQQNELEQRQDILRELKILHPEIKSAGFTTLYNNEENNESTETLIILVNESPDTEQLDRLKNWLNNKLNSEIQILPVITT